MRFSTFSLATVHALVALGAFACGASVDPYEENAINGEEAEAVASKLSDGDIRAFYCLTDCFWQNAHNFEGEGEVWNYCVAQCQGEAQGGSTPQPVEDTSGDDQTGDSSGNDGDFDNSGEEADNSDDFGGDQIQDPAGDTEPPVDSPDSDSSDEGDFAGGGDFPGDSVASEEELPATTDNELSCEESCQVNCEGSHNWDACQGSCIYNNCREETATDSSEDGFEEEAPTPDAPLSCDDQCMVDCVESDPLADPTVCHNNCVQNVCNAPPPTSVETTPEPRPTPQPPLSCEDECMVGCVESDPLADPTVCHNNCVQFQCNAAPPPPPTPEPEPEPEPEIDPAECRTDCQVGCVEANPLQDPTNCENECFRNICGL